MAGQNDQPTLLAPGLLLIASVAGFVFSNSALSGFYQNFLDTKLQFSIGGLEILNKTSLQFINDGLMAVFFLFIGLELKREVLVGELSNVRQAILPVFAALGGMFIPALIYFGFNSSGEASGGWGIPMATDIAFALGVLAVLGSRVPAKLKIMLAAVAIVDDLGAILVIALFYTAKIDTHSLLLAFLFLGLCVVANRAGIMKVSVYLLLGVPVWFFMLKSGVHATIAGVLLAATIPLAPKNKSRALLITDIFAKTASPLDSPAVFLEKSLLKWIGFVIVPIFAFSNSGVALGVVEFGTVSLGVIFGLVFGKPLGIAGASWLAVTLKLAKLPAGVNWSHMIGIGFLAGIGFTMSLFIGSLAFQNIELSNEAKLAILIGSFISAFFGIIFLLRAKEKNPALVI